jgi:hypothetical protein
MEHVEECLRRLVIRRVIDPARTQLPEEPLDAAAQVIALRGAPGDHRPTVPEVRITVLKPEPQAMRRAGWMA